jgi:hypothetical protein
MFRLVAEKGSHKITVVMKTKAFDRSNRRMRIDKDGDRLKVV